RKPAQTRPHAIRGEGGIAEDGAVQFLSRHRREGDKSAMTDPYAQARNIVLNMIETPLASKEQLREAIAATVELLRRRQPEVTVDEERLYRDLEAAVDVYQPESISLENNAGHLPWLTP